MASEETSTDNITERSTAGDGPRTRVNVSNLKSSYCNVANATSTREEVVLNFGINQNWDQGQGEMDVQLLHRIILSPFAAKRLADMLAKLMNEYEHRHGNLA